MIINKQEVVEFMRQILQPSYNSGLLPAEQFAEIVRNVSSQLFKRPEHELRRPDGMLLMTADGSLEDEEEQQQQRWIHWKDFIREKISTYFSG